jgi:transposase-like protein
MEQDIIAKYNTNHSIESLAKEFKIGKIKIKKILIDNHIPLKSKGGQVKNKQVEQIIHLDSKVKCKNCGKEFNDIENKSGGLTNHIKQCHPNIEILSSFKRRMFLKNTGNYWHLIYFDVIEKNIETHI